MGRVRALPKRNRLRGAYGVHWYSSELSHGSNPPKHSISQKRITAVAINSTGEWLAFGCAKLGQLLVWEWKSESYVLKQQGMLSWRRGVWGLVGGGGGLWQNVCALRDLFLGRPRSKIVLRTSIQAYASLSARGR